MISLIFICLAAVCNSIMDAIVHHDAFSKYKQWWRQDGWRLKYNWEWTNISGKYEFSKFERKKCLWGLINKPVQICDAWHFFKLCMLFFFLMSDISLLTGYKEHIEWMQFNPTGNIWWDIAIYKAIWGIAWIQPFNLFYNKIWKKK